MIRKLGLLAATAVLFVFVAWNFMTEGLLYNPLSEGIVKKAKIKESVPSKTSYSAAWDASIAEKNLFNPLRTYKEPKPPAPPPPPPPPPPKKPDLVLKGIVLDTFGDYVAYVEINQQKVTQLRKGDKVEDIEVSDITEKSVVLKWLNETITLTIEKVKTLSGKPRTGK